MSHYDVNRGDGESDDVNRNGVTDGVGTAQMTPC